MLKAQEEAHKIALINWGHLLLIASFSLRCASVNLCGVFACLSVFKCTRKRFSWLRYQVSGVTLKPREGHATNKFYLLSKLIENTYKKGTMRSETGSLFVRSKSEIWYFTTSGTPEHIRVGCTFMVKKMLKELLYSLTATWHKTTYLLADICKTGDLSVWRNTHHTNYHLSQV